MVPCLSVTELTKEILEKTGYRQELVNQNNLEAQARLENLEEFLSVTQEFDKRFEAQNEDDADAPDEKLSVFLNDLALLSDVDSYEEESSQVTLMTLHAAKGLEFPVVFLIGLEENIFPLSRALMEESELEEERRLAYVGITRSEEELFMTSVSVYRRDRTRSAAIIRRAFTAESCCTVSTKSVQTELYTTASNDRRF